MLGTELYAKAVAILKAEHQKVFIITKKAKEVDDTAEAEITKDTTEEPKEDLQIPTAPKEETDDEDDIITGFSCNVFPKNREKDEEEDPYAKADKLLDKFLTEDQISNSYLLDCATRLPEDKGARIRINKVIASFNIIKYYKVKGSKDYPSICQLARTQFLRMENSGFQERVFSTGGNAMTKK